MDILIKGPGEVTVCLVDRVDPFPTGMVLGGSAGEGAPLRIEVIDFAVWLAGPNQLRQCLRKRAMKILTFAKRPLGSHALCHVAPDRRNEQAAVGSPLAK